MINTRPHTIGLIFYFIAILFIFPLMFKTNMFHITYVLKRFKLSLIAKGCQLRVVLTLFTNMTLKLCHITKSLENILS